MGLGGASAGGEVGSFKCLKMRSTRGGSLISGRCRVGQEVGTRILATTPGSPISVLNDLSTSPSAHRPDLWQVVDRLEPYGEANPSLTFLTRQLKIVNCEVIGRRESVHLKLLFDSGQFKWPAVYWNASEKLGVEFDIGDEVEVAYHFTKNYYGGGETFQLVVLDINR